MNEERARPLDVFIHVPKNAGTTFRSILQANYEGGVGFAGNAFKGGGGTDPTRIRRLRDSSHVVTRGMTVLTGHIPFGVRAYLPPDTRYVTFLRDPVERTISHYYGLLQAKKRASQHEGSTLEEILTEGKHLHDNLQTRMLSDVEEPFGEVTPEMLEQAKSNLAEAFLAFGLVERFDESLVLLKRRLGLRSILYVRRRMTRGPLGDETRKELRTVAERFNTYDLELYRWASELFEQAVADEGVDFAIELAALRAALSPRADVGAPPSASELDPDRLWELLVRARAKLLTLDAELHPKARVREAEDLRALVEETNANVLALKELLLGELGETFGELATGNATQRGRRRAKSSGGARRNAGRSPEQRLELQTKRLEQLRARIDELEEAAEEGEDPGAADELARVRAEAEDVEQRIQALERRHGVSQQEAAE